MTVTTRIPKPSSSPAPCNASRPSAHAAYQKDPSFAVAGGRSPTSPAVIQPMSFDYSRHQHFPSADLLMNKTTHGPLVILRGSVTKSTQYWRYQCRRHTKHGASHQPSVSSQVPGHMSTDVNRVIFETQDMQR